MNRGSPAPDRSLLPVLIFVAAFVGLPLAVVLGGSLLAGGGAGEVARVAGDPLDRAALSNSLLQGGLSAALAGAIGYPVGLTLGRYIFPGREALSAFLLVPFLLPSLVVILGFGQLFGPGGWVAGALPPLGALGHGLVGILAVNAYFDSSLVALLTATAVAGGSRTQEEAVALLGGSPARGYAEIWGPLSWLGAGAGMLLTFLLSAMGFAAPLVICGASCYTLEVRIWSLAEVLGQPAAAGVLGLLALLLLAVPTVAYLLVRDRAHRRVAPSAAPERSLRRAGPLAWAGLAYTVLFVLAIVGLLAAVLLRSVLTPAGAVTLAGWRELFDPGLADRLGITTAGAIGNSLFLATGAAILALLLALLTVFARRVSRRRNRGLEFVVFLPVLVSPVLLAFGLATLWRPALGGPGDTWALLLLAQATVALPFVLQSLTLAVDRIGPAPWEAAQALGSSPWAAFLDIDLPRARRGLLSAALFAFAIGLGEFTATFFLYLPEFTTVPVELLRLGELRLPLAEAAAGALLVLLSLGVFALIEVGGRRIEL